MDPAVQVAEYRDWEDRTPLHVAASNGCYTLAKWLIRKHRVGVNPVDKSGRTPLAVRSEELIV